MCVVRVDVVLYVGVRSLFVLCGSVCISVRNCMCRYVSGCAIIINYVCLYCSGCVCIVCVYVCMCLLGMLSVMLYVCRCEYVCVRLVTDVGFMLDIMHVFVTDFRVFCCMCMLC